MTVGYIFWTGKIQIIHLLLCHTYFYVWVLYILPETPMVRLLTSCRQPSEEGRLDAKCLHRMWNRFSYRIPHSICSCPWVAGRATRGDQWAQSIWLHSIKRNLSWAEECRHHVGGKESDHSVPFWLSSLEVGQRGFRFTFKLGVTISPKPKNLGGTFSLR